MPANTSNHNNSRDITKAKIDKSIKRPLIVSEAIIRPTGLLDPEIILKPVTNQVDDVLAEVRNRIFNGQRVLITTLTKKFAEELDLYFKQINIKSAYIHSDVETLERLDILADLRRGRYDVLIGINLLREGLDLPEVSLVAIFDADKEGFLRSRTSLIQIIGRAARHLEGKVIMYADTLTESMKQAIEETNKRRQKQTEYNILHGITPKSASRKLKTIADDVREEVSKDDNFGKAGAVYTPTGFVQKEAEHNSSQLTFEIESRYKRNKKPEKTANRGMQVYANFDAQSLEIRNELQKLDLSSGELKERLQIAIDSYNFEEAAAIRDLLKDTGAA